MLHLTCSREVAYRWMSSVTFRCCHHSCSQVDSDISRGFSDTTALSTLDSIAKVLGKMCSYTALHEVQCKLQVILLTLLHKRLHLWCIVWVYSYACRWIEALLTWLDQVTNSEQNSSSHHLIITSSACFCCVHSGESICMQLLDIFALMLIRTSIS